MPAGAVVQSDVVVTILLLRDRQMATQSRRYINLCCQSGRSPTVKLFPFRCYNRYRKRAQDNANECCASL
jgi:hypothetical protein